jgi:hypothetical protein
VPLAPELSVLSADVETDAEGSYTLAAATLGTHSWKADKACVDAATKVCARALLSWWRWWWWWRWW